MSKAIAELRNLGPITESMLNQAGIMSAEELLDEDPVDVYILLKIFGFRVNHNMLWALYGAINDKDFKDLSEADKKKLRKKLKAADTA